MWSKGWNNSGLQAPQGASPFAPAPQGGAAPAGRPDEAATGPMLGKGSELRKLYYMPHNMGHGDAVNCMLMADGKIYTGGRDEYLFVWKPDRAANGEIQLSQDCPPIHLGASITSLFYEPTSKWLFCGLWNGEVRGFCKEPMRDDRLQGHRRSVTALQVHSGVLISGSNEGGSFIPSSFFLGSCVLRCVKHRRSSLEEGGFPSSGTGGQACAKNTRNQDSPETEAQCGFGPSMARASNRTGSL